MKHIYAIIALLVLLAIAVVSQAQKMPPPQPLPVAYAQFCGNIVIVTAAKTAMFEQMQSDGCAVTHFVDLGDDYWLAYGVRVTREMQ
jgi:hypothetical protein